MYCTDWSHPNWIAIYCIIYSKLLRSQGMGTILLHFLTYPCLSLQFYVVYLSLCRMHGFGSFTDFIIKPTTRYSYQIWCASVLQYHTSDSLPHVDIEWRINSPFHTSLHSPSAEFRQYHKPVDRAVAIEIITTVKPRVCHYFLAHTAQHSNLLGKYAPVLCSNHLKH